jgi:aldehyde:ferredoxin oxidoreductase
MYGWHGRVLRVNLTEGTIREESFSEEVARKFLGARGLAIRYLLKGLVPRPTRYHRRTCWSWPPGH